MLGSDGLTSVVAVTASMDGVPYRLPNLNGLPVEQCALTDVWECLEQFTPDAVVVAACDDDHFHLFTSLHDSYDLDQRPTIILFADAPPARDCAVLIDAVFPCQDHPLVPYQIQQAVEQKKRSAALQERVDLLEATNRSHMRRQEMRERTADEVDLLKNVIVRNVTHELSTPLIQVKAAVSLLFEDAKKDSLTDLAFKATARLEGVVRNITQLAASLDETRRSPMIVRDSVDAALRDLRRTWEFKEQMPRIEVQIDDHLPLAYADRAGISTVLLQLIDNGLKFSQDTVEVSAHWQDEAILISVRDYGIGIPSEHLDGIFESFYQIDPSSKRSYGGAGVGLAIVRLILDRHGIDIQVESEENRGTTFAFSLPPARP